MPAVMYWARVSVWPWRALSKRRAARSRACGGKEVAEAAVVADVVAGCDGSDADAGVFWALVGCGFPVESWGRGEL